MSIEDEGDIQKSKADIYNSVIEQKNRKAAKRLKDYWKKTGDWNVKKRQKKQFEKVENIKEFLE